MVPNKRKSKRQPLKKKYKVLKNIKNSKKKRKRDMKKHPEKYPKQKDPGIPHKLPFYKEVIEELQAAKASHTRRIEEARERRKEMKTQPVAQKRNISDLSVEELIKYAKERGDKYDLSQTFKRKAEDDGADAKPGLNDKSARAYYREFKKVVEAADVVLEVLDARDPLGTRVTQLEAVVTGELSKKLVLVLNKADLVPRENLEKWLKYLRQEYPTIVFKCSTQVQGIRLGQTSAKVMKVDEDVMHTSKCLGADVLMQLLKNYCRNKDIKTAITVGVVGLPNVGKSSLINSLKRSKSCGVGATPGFTKSMQEIILDSKVKLLDCPGIVLPGRDADDSTAALRNAVKIEELSDVYTPVDAILQRADKEHIMIHYRLSAFKTTDDFLSVLAKRLGKLKRKGVPNKEAAAHKLLHDWNTGVIKYYTQPPTATDTQVNTTLVDKLSAEFDLASIREDEGSMMMELPIHRPSKIMKIRSLGPVKEVKSVDQDSDMEDDDDEEEEEEEEESSTGLLGKEVHIDMEPEAEKPKENRKKQRWETERPTFDPKTMCLQKYQKKMQKKDRKESNRNDRKIDGLVSVLDGMMKAGTDDTKAGTEDTKASTEDYKFDEFF